MEAKARAGALVALTGWLGGELVDLPQTLATR